MAIITKAIKLETTQQNLIQAVIAKQNDCNSRFLKITFLNEGSIIPLDSNSDVTINAERKDGSSKSFFGVVNDDDTATVPLHSWILELDGEVSCDISIIGSDSRLTTTGFVVKVEKAANSGDDISSDPQYDVLINLIDEVTGTKCSVSNALKGTASGSPIVLNDVSPMEHEMQVKVSPTLEEIGEITNIDNGEWTNYPNYGEYVVDHIDYEDTMGEGRVVFTDGSSLDCGMCLYASISDIQQGDTVRFDYDREYDDPEYWHAYFLRASEEFKDTMTELCCLTDNSYGDDFREGYGDYTVLSVERGDGDTVFLVFTDGSSCSYWDVRDNYHLIEIGSVIRYYLKPFEGDYISLVKKGKSITDVTLTQCGKNLVDISQMLNNVLVDNGNGTFAYTRPSSNIYSAAFPLKLKAGTTITINMVQISTTDYSDRLTCFFTYADGTSKSSYIGRGTGMNFTAEKDIVKVQLFSYNVGTKFVFRNFQIELGTTTSAYGSHIEPILYTPNADGTISGVTSLYPTTTLISDTEGVTIKAEYNRDINKAFESLLNMMNS